MTHNDWSALLDNPEVARSTLGAPPPPLTDYDLTMVHIDEREASVSLCFFAFGVPSGAVIAWETNGHNAVEFFLVCTGARNFTVDGWTPDPLTSIALTERSAVLSGDQQRVSFDFTGIRVEAVRGFRASREP